MSALFLKILNMSVCASWIAAAVLILRFCLKRAPKWVNVLLWGFVAARLICPVSIESALSLIPRADAISSAVLTAPGQTAAAPVIGGAAAAGAAANPLQTWIPILAWVCLPALSCFFCTPPSARSGCAGRSARQFVCGGTFISPSKSPHRSCLGRSSPGSIFPTVWAAATNSTSSHTNRPICGAAITCGSRLASCC